MYFRFLENELACYMGLELGKVDIKCFIDGEIYVQLYESDKRV
ncbi:putative ribose-phosphate diphosphokinase [Helianthus annuus]|nr:putative ribose-phosphate diphosphokinase [Helianthus annuus]KAJ0772703.1 putative ribose-phosphate diphosphokinase [Helianthus annuus]